MSLLLALGPGPAPAPSIIGGCFDAFEDEFILDEEAQAVFLVTEEPVVVVAFVDSFKPDLDDDVEDLPPDHLSQWIDFIQTVFRMVGDEAIDEQDDLGDYLSQFLEDYRIEVVEYSDDDGLDDEVETYSFFIPDTPVVAPEFVDSFKTDQEDDEDETADFVALVYETPVVVVPLVFSTYEQTEDEEAEVADYAFWPLQTDLVQLVTETENEEDEPSDYIGLITEQVSIIQVSFELEEDEDVDGDWTFKQEEVVVVASFDLYSLPFVDEESEDLETEDYLGLRFDVPAALPLDFFTNLCDTDDDYEDDGDVYQSFDFIRTKALLRTYDRLSTNVSITTHAVLQGTATII